MKQRKHYIVQHHVKECASCRRNPFLNQVGSVREGKTHDGIN